MKPLLEELTLQLRRIRKDVQLMETGAFKLLLNQEDITTDWMRRQRGAAIRLERLLEKYEATDA